VAHLQSYTWISELLMDCVYHYPSLGHMLSFPYFNLQHYKRLSIYQRPVFADYNKKNLAIQLIDHFVTIDAFRSISVLCSQIITKRTWLSNWLITLSLRNSEASIAYQHHFLS
jgi:hypothetical protein